jgi:hypothetical protein
LITISSATITIADTGLYQVFCSATWNNLNTAPESKCQLYLKKNITGTYTEILQASDQQVATADGSSIMGNAALGSLISVTAGDQFRFSFTSANDSTASLSAASHAYIIRIL